MKKRGSLTFGSKIDGTKNALVKFFIFQENKNKIFVILLSE